MTEYAVEVAGGGGVTKTKIHEMIIDGAVVIIYHRHCPPPLPPFFSLSLSLSLFFVLRILLFNWYLDFTYS